MLLDQISWMAIGDPDFAGHFNTAWDNLFSRHPRLIVVLCGSVSSWIQKNIRNSTGFVGRCSWQFRLQPLPLSACNEFWKGKTVNAAEKLKVLCVTGGVPRYLEEIDPAQTLFLAHGWLMNVDVAENRLLGSASESPITQPRAQRTLAIATAYRW